MIENMVQDLTAATDGLFMKESSGRRGFMTSDQEKREQDSRETSNQIHSYVYPHQYSQNNSGYGNHPPEGPSSKTRAIGILVGVLALVVLFSALTSGLVYVYMRQQRAPQETTPAETVQDEDLAPDPTPAPQEEPEQEDSQGLRSPHFSLESAAASQDRAQDPLPITEIVEMGKPAVVAISTETTVEDFFGQVMRIPAAGSGFIISEDGYIVTNNHVIERADQITVVLDNDDLYEAQVVGRDPQNDLAVIKVEAENLPTVVLGESKDLQIGELAVAIGNPLGELSGSVTAGVISGLDREINIDGQRLNLLQTDAAINQGNSGGALFNSFGEVIGINTAKSSGAGIEGLGFAIPIDHAKPIVESIIQSGYVTGRPRIGIATRDISSQMAEHYSLTEGVYIVDVEPFSAAERAGLRRGDIIVATDGEETLTTSQINDLRNQMEPGDEMELTIVRENETMQVTVVLDEDVPE